MRLAAVAVLAVFVATSAGACGGEGKNEAPAADERPGTTATAAQGPSEEEIASEAEAIERHREEFERIGERLGRLRHGMSEQKVRAILGEPDRVETGEVDGRAVQCWRYLQLPAGDPAERFARIFRICFRDGRWADMRRLLADGTPNEVRFLLGRPDSTFRRNVAGRPSMCWRWDYRIAEETICFRRGRVVYERSSA